MSGPPPAASLATLQTILALPPLLSAFEDFAKRERKDENLVLLRAINEFKRAEVNTSRIVRCADVIRLLRTGNINANPKTRSALEGALVKLKTLQDEGNEEQVLKELEGVHSEMLALEGTIHRELVGDALPRFLRSPQYQAAAESSGAAASKRRTSMAANLLNKIGGSFRVRSGDGLSGGGGGAAIGLAVSSSSSSPPPANPPIPFLSLGGVSERKQALLDILGHSAACACFVDFCRREHNDENIECLLDLRALRKLLNSNNDAAGGGMIELRKRKAREVLDTYIRAGSSKEANVDSRTRAQAETCLARVAATGLPLDSPEVLFGSSSSSAPPPPAASAGAGSSAPLPSPDSASSSSSSLTTPGGTSSSSTGSGSSSNDAIAKVELELINMLSGEVLPRFINNSKLWSEFVASYPGGQLKERSSTPSGSGSGGGGSGGGGSGLPSPGPGPGPVGGSGFAPFSSSSPSPFDSSSGGGGVGGGGDGVSSPSPEPGLHAARNARLSSVAFSAGSSNSSSSSTDPLAAGAAPPPATAATSSTASAANTSPAAPPPAAAPSTSGKTSGFLGFRRKDKDKDAAAAAPSAAPGSSNSNTAASSAGPADGVGVGANGLAVAQRLRDKIYLFGVSLKKPRSLFTSKKTETELGKAGSAIREAAIKGGFLMKRAHHKSSWKRRWFILSPFALAYFETTTAPSPNGVILVSEICAVSSTWDPNLCKINAAFTSGGAGGGGGGGVGGGSDGGVDDAPSAAAPVPSSGSGGNSKAPPPLPSDVASLNHIFFVYTAHRPYTFQACNERDRNRWLFALECARRGDVEAIKNAEKTGYAGLEGSTLSSWLLTHATRFSAPPSSTAALVLNLDVTAHDDDDDDSDSEGGEGEGLEDGEGEGDGDGAMTGVAGAGAARSPAASHRTAFTDNEGGGEDGSTRSLNLAPGGGGGGGASARKTAPPGALPTWAESDLEER